MPQAFQFGTDHLDSILFLLKLGTAENDLEYFSPVEKLIRVTNTEKNLSECFDKMLVNQTKNWKQWN